MAKLNDIDVDDYLAKAVDIEPLAIQEEYVRLPADLAYWNQKYSEAYSSWLGQKLHRKRMVAMLTLEHRERLLSLDGKKATVDAIRASVEDDERLMRVEEMEIALEVEKIRLWGVLDAVRAKREMLVSLGAHIRAEMQGDPRVNREVRDARTVTRDDDALFDSSSKVGRPSRSDGS